MTASGQRILVIKLGALGDFVLATGPFAAIRNAHSQARITLLTTAPFADLAARSPYFDDVWVDERPGKFDIAGILRLRRKLRGGRFSRVYDLQTSDRSGLYFRLFPAFAKPEWSGIAAGCSHPHANPDRDRLHTIERQAEQLAAAGIPSTPPPDLSWAEGEIGRFDLPAPPGRFALLIPGAAPHRPAKRWPAANFMKIAGVLAARGVRPVVVGGPNDIALAQEIARGAGGLSLAGATSLGDLAALSRKAAGAIGNDTGPMHVAAICGCPALVLFSSDSDPALTAPRGPSVTVLQRPDLAELSVATVAEALSLR